MTTLHKFKYKAEGYGKQWDPTRSITAYFTGLDKFRTSLSDRGISTSVDEMTMAAGARMWENEMFTKDQMVAWENKTPAQQTHQGSNGCLGEQNPSPANLAGSPRILHREVVGTPPVFTSNGKTLKVQGRRSCSAKNGSSRGRRRNVSNDVCSSTRATSATQ